MADTVVERTVVNKGRKMAKKRKLSPKQVKYFGTPAEKAALRRSRTNGKKKTKRASASKRSHAHRKNAGEIIGYTLANTGRKKGKKMATTKKPRSKHNAAGGGRHKHHTTKKSRRNTGMKHHRRTRRNAGASVGGLGSMAIDAVFLIAGAVGSKILTQAVLGSNNVGAIGYLGNAVSGGVLWFLADRVMKNRRIANELVKGTAVQIVLRLINDYTPFGQYVANLGMGDYQAQAFVTPQILQDPYYSAAIKIPGAWTPPPPLPAPAPQTPTAAAAAAGVGAYGGGNLYGGGSTLY